MSAVLLISGLGCHDVWMNGTRVGDHVLDPAQTDYERRVLFVRHDVTGLVQAGDNAIGVILGNGWYNQDRVWEPGGLSYGKPRLMAELHLVFPDDEVTVIRADTAWRWADGPVIDNNLYAGERYDARREIDGWYDAGFDDSGWPFAETMDPPGGTLQEQVMPPMRRIETLAPAAITRDGDGHVVDFGQNFSGWARFQVHADPGTEITLRYAETIHPDGSIDTASTGVFATDVEQIDRYVCRGSDVEGWEPRFTYHGFRYVEVTGWPGDLTAEDIAGVVVHNDLKTIGTFACSDDRLNTLHNMALWTHRTNTHGFPEDCPAREKCGWLGDANLVAEYSLWNYDGRRFWEKYLGDIETGRSFNDGLPAGVHPGKRASRGPAPPDWAAAFIMLPWYLYQFSGDRNVIDRHWPGMQRLMDHYETTAEGWMLRDGYGDFFDPGADAIVQHTPVELTSTLWFFRCARVMAAMAEARDEPAWSATYRDWSERISAALRATHFDQAAGSLGSQTANAMALAFDVLPAETDRLVAALVSDIRARDNHLNVGVMGVRFVLEGLTRHGHGALALAVMRQDTYPSFGDLIGRGATTLWEYWGEAEIDATHGPRSLNHPFMGGYDNWFFNTLAGIRPDPAAPGFQHVYLEPHPVPGLKWVNGRHRGFASHWQQDDQQFQWQVVIPEGCSATARMPFSREVVPVEAGAHELTDAR